MFDFIVTGTNGAETVSELKSDDILYSLFISSNRTATEINVYITDRSGPGLVCRYRDPLYQNLDWGGPQTLMYVRG